MKNFLRVTVVASLFACASLAQAQSSNNSNEANVGKQDTSHSSADQATNNPNVTTASTSSKKMSKKKPANNTKCPSDTTKQSGSPDFSGCKQSPEYK